MFSYQSSHAAAGGEREREREIYTLQIFVSSLIQLNDQKNRAGSTSIDIHLIAANFDVIIEHNSGARSQNSNKSPFEYSNAPSFSLQCVTRLTLTDIQPPAETSLGNIQFSKKFSALTSTFATSAHTKLNWLYRCSCFSVKC